MGTVINIQIESPIELSAIRNGVAIGPKGDKGDKGNTSTSFVLHDARVTGRNINITSIGYTPQLKEIIYVLPDSSIIEGGPITLSINEENPVEILNYISHDEQYCLLLIFLEDYWGVFGRQKENYIIS